MIRVKLSGGLGNQLFQYFAGARQSIESSDSLVLDFKDVYLGKLERSLITSFSLPVSAEFINVNPSRFKIYLGKIVLAIKYRFSQILPGIVGEPGTDDISTQNYENYNFVISRVNLKPKLASPSDWFISMSTRIQGEPIIAVHIRRGDYILPRNRETIGVLKDTFFIECLNQAINAVGLLPIWVFSDSQQVKTEFSTVLPPDTEFIYPPEGTDPAESVVLMSYAKVLIISNSTFSWWSACMSDRNAIVYCPDPWFKSLEQPLDLTLNSWRKVKSEWEY